MQILAPAALFAALLIPAAAGAAIQTETVEYSHGDSTLKGHLVYDDSIEGKRPGVIVAHEWWGLNDYARQRARMLAELGYVAFAIDMYGDQRVTRHAPDAKGWMQQITANVEDWRARALAGLEALKADPRVDTDKLAAVGYCFGGATVLQMAYAGANLDGVVSLHGSLPPAPEDSDIKASILAAHGFEDPFVPAERVAAFQQSLQTAGADWQLVVYGDARHAFTNPAAGDYGIDALRYDAEADSRSWAQMQGFFDQIFSD
ncbi:dienelactone hydrolase family protein [Thiohalocapsa marina]|uniref:dienelactone hydrolase family protein n=1 Tax=Thiohalocapsa marina TaxID=424902 RepID=UPI0036DCF372